MAVYTHLTPAQLTNLLMQYNIGELVSAQPIAEGVENSNYLLITKQQQRQQRFILTLYEKRVNLDDLPFFLNLMQHLANSGINCPLPIKRSDGQLIGEIAGKAFSITSFLEGGGVKRIGNNHLYALGGATAHLHLAAKSFPHTRNNEIAPSQLQSLFEKVAPKLNQLLPDLRQQLAPEIEAMQKWQHHPLPKGIIHADLFADNVFFIGEMLTGIIDFYFACSDYLAYDLAIILNAWCFERGADFNITKAQYLLSGYNQHRTLSPQELDALPYLARGAALRFLLTRAHDWFFPVEGAVVKPKDPMEYYHKWLFHCRTQTYQGYVL